MKDPSPYFDKDELIELAKEQCSITSSPLERIICSISLMRLGETPEYIAWNLNDESFQKDCDTFPFFTAPMLSGTSNRVLNYLKKFDIFKIHFRSKAFYYSLLLEYEVLMKTTSYAAK